MAGLLLNIDVKDNGTIVVQKFNQTVAAGKKPVDDLAKSTAGLDDASAALSKTMALLGISFGVKQILDMTTAYETLEARISAVDGIGEQQAATMQSILQISDETRTSINDTGQAYFKFAEASQTLGISHQELIPLVKEFNELQKIAGLSSEQAAREVGLFSASMFTGEFNGRAFTAMLRQLPQVGALIAQQFGVATQTLSDYSEKGLISTQRAMEAILNVAPLVESQFKTLPVTAEGAGARLANSLEKAFGEMEKGSGIVTRLTDLMDKLGGSADRNAGFFENFGKTLTSGFEGAVSIVAMMGGYAQQQFSGKKNNALNSMADVGFQDIAKKWTGINPQVDNGSSTPTIQGAKGATDAVNSLAEANAKQAKAATDAVDPNARLVSQLEALAQVASAAESAAKAQSALDVQHNAALAGSGLISGIERQRRDLQSETDAAQSAVDAAQAKFDSQSLGADSKLTDAAQKKLESSKQELALLQAKNKDLAYQSGAIDKQVASVGALAAVEQQRAAAEQAFALAQDKTANSQKLTSLDVAGGRLTPLQGISADFAGQKQALEEQIKLQQQLQSFETARDAQATAKINATEAGDPVKLAEEKETHDANSAKLIQAQLVAQQQIAELPINEQKTRQNELDRESYDLAVAKAAAVTDSLQNETQLAERLAQAQIDALPTDTYDEIVVKEKAITAEAEKHLAAEKAILETLIAQDENALGKIGISDAERETALQKLDNDTQQLASHQAIAAAETNARRLQETTTLRDNNLQLKHAVDFTQSLADLGGQAFEDMAISGKKFKDVLPGIISDLEKLIFQLTVIQPLKDAIAQSGKTGSLASLFGFGGGAAATSAPGASAGALGDVSGFTWTAKGDAFSGGITHSGPDIVSRPTTFAYFAKGGVMGEAGPEAVMPLVRGADGRLGVSSHGGQGSGGSVVVNVTNSVSGAQATARESQGPNGEHMIDVMVAQAHSRNVRKGVHDGDYSGRYSLNPRGSTSNAR